MKELAYLCNICEKTIKIRIAILALSLATVQTAWAACANPAGGEGDMRYATNHKVMAFCNGTDWVAMGSVSPGGANILADLNDVSTAGVNVCSILAYNGSQWVVSSTLYTETDPKVGTLTNGRWCTSNGSTISCTANPPAMPDATDLVPSGMVAAFVLAACPSGWSEYTPARGRFLRGIDNGAGNDPAGTRAVGNVQADALQNISGAFNARSWGASSVYTALWSPSGAFALNGDTDIAGSVDMGTNAVGKSFIFDASRVARTANETRPKNVAVLFCRKD